MHGGGHGRVFMLREAGPRVVVVVVVVVYS